MEKWQLLSYIPLMLITYFYLIKCEVSKFLCMPSLYLFLFNCPGDSVTPFFRDTVLYLCHGLSYLRYFSTNNLVHDFSFTLFVVWPFSVFFLVSHLQWFPFPFSFSSLILFCFFLGGERDECLNSVFFSNLKPSLKPVDCLFHVLKNAGVLVRVLLLWRHHDPSNFYKRKRLIGAGWHLLQHGHMSLWRHFLSNYHMLSASHCVLFSLGHST